MIKRLLATILVFSIAVIPTYAYDWSDIAYKLSKSTAMLTTWEGQVFCSAFSIDKERHYVITAAHCVDWNEDGFLVDGVFPQVMFFDEALDVAVLYVYGMNRPELKPRTKLIKVGMEVGAFGFAPEDGLKAHFRAGNVSGIEFSENGLIWVLVDQSAIGGMSGGPVVDTDGKVIMVTQISDRVRHLGGRDMESVYRATKEFWRD